MSLERDDPGLSIRLEWPDDPVLQTPVARGESADPETLARRFAAAEEAANEIAGADAAEVADRIDRAVRHILNLLQDLLQAYTARSDATLEAVDGRIADLLNSVTLMLDTRLASDDERQTTMETRFGARADELERKANEQAHVIADHLAALGRQFSEVAKEMQERSELQADALASGLRDLRRRIAVGRGGVDDRFIDELVTRVADEVEIRIAATAKPKPSRRGRS